DKRFSDSVKLPHIPRPKMKVCMLGDAQHVEKKIDLEYMDVEGLKKLNQNKNKLAKKFHAFLASEAVIKQIPRLLGPGKFPTLVTHQESFEAKVNETKAMVKFQLKKVFCMGVVVGNLGMEEKQIFRNVQLSVNFLVSLMCTLGDTNFSGFPYGTPVKYPILWHSGARFNVQRESGMSSHLNKLASEKNTSTSFDDADLNPTPMRRFRSINSFNSPRIKELARHSRANRGNGGCECNSVAGGWNEADALDNVGEVCPHSMVFKASSNHRAKHGFCLDDIGVTCITTAQATASVKFPTNAPLGCNCTGACIDSRKCACAKLIHCSKWA
ncbi:hypothetical protein C5167_030591, partial [Papaver somniferum]